MTSSLLHGGLGPRRLMGMGMAERIRIRMGQGANRWICSLAAVGGTSLITTTSTSWKHARSRYHTPFAQRAWNYSCTRMQRDGDRTHVTGLGARVGPGLNDSPHSRASEAGEALNPLRLPLPQSMIVLVLALDRMVPPGGTMQSEVGCLSIARGAISAQCGAEAECRPPAVSAVEREEEVQAPVSRTQQPLAPRKR